MQPGLIQTFTRQEFPGCAARPYSYLHKAGVPLLCTHLEERELCFGGASVDHKTVDVQFLHNIFLETQGQVWSCSNPQKEEKEKDEGHQEVMPPANNSEGMPLANNSEGMPHSADKDTKKSCLQLAIEKACL